MARPVRKGVITSGRVFQDIEKWRAFNGGMSPNPGQEPKDFRGKIRGRHGFLDALGEGLWTGAGVLAQSVFIGEGQVHQSLGQVGRAQGRNALGQHLRQGPRPGQQGLYPTRQLRTFQRAQALEICVRRGHIGTIGRRTNVFTFGRNNCVDAVGC